MKIHGTEMEMNVVQWIECDNCFTQNPVAIPFRFTKDGVEADDTEFTCKECEERRLACYISYFTTSEV